ncbi:2-C-methyl-D-erythritol 2,4-cyclodiphosphate synthase [Ehrlichia chaffeensis str. Heartland]|uniref:2-C-methyl-D-erythritol 2,4-cyclodiphosphate synthase n=1 Tax=Ehrlichia chaffeensis (strain ATCC CRL-10679 / Arkansas) TaxID=205920 RepID=ISPF_EHRCR|nr:2-C-methyl-D-erythritol 2,4-cyclodiphosphate synthase [Ehrlichia chaffeensis]Q2GHV0.1 RecName: Full=2-C-methyl-D-erythritol 2,4-cyclodiphosphate synthase; Short=MECDP-synthase; Short=MECPP-synthase; Short=MECPS [Ehrlichia chaffeensis str. Arkansas]ABD45293.1 2C-methyl-D-erythritol 2,4-cyclodiphosphate synthase [Ehrlichia chaffeensis str. Arkansas]AHX04047.1 2-C-methyl-D-erythritol 2,4-cyclodiphosphate synthase [Ehrlichia chaffeensis str. Heartland]AHX05981.1 2-C-methyl-D-erythritol 2,4-cyclo
MNQHPNKPIFKVGIGYDVHKFDNTCYNDANTFITICGIKINYHKKIIAHSDGDVGLHALTDAILGAVGCGSIGQHFPNTDNTWKNIKSDYFLIEAQKKAQEKGYSISNADITIICEQPKIMPHALEMQEYIANLICIDPSCINVKATTTEKLGFLGRKEGIAAQAIVLCCLQN